MAVDLCESDVALLNRVRHLEMENRRLAEQNISQQKALVSLERKISKFDEIREQRDWLLEEMTNKISEVSRFQTDLFKAERFSAIGEMSARLAHDMRNPLAIIKNTVELVKMKHTSAVSRDLLHLFCTIDNASSRLVFQLDQVLNFVRSSPLKCDHYSLKHILKSAISKIVVPDGTVIHLPDYDVQLLCDMEKIEAVFTNLIMNAIQATENSGDVRIRFLETDDSVDFDVQDSGPGIPDCIRDKIFEPLFTTKSRGTGLGLPTVKSIIQQHQGAISVTNNPTTFSVTLPKRPLVI